MESHEQVVVVFILRCAAIVETYIDTVETEHSDVSVF